MTARTVRRSLFAASISTAFAATMLHAQQAAPPSGQVELEEVVITARLRSEQLQDIPLAVSALQSKDLERAGVQDLRALTEQFAGLQLDTTGGHIYSTPVIRGMSQVSRIDDENNVSMFIDGVYVAGRDGIDSGLLDLERVEVVRGPQSALYGRNSYAGAINLVTRKPSETFSGNAQVIVGSESKLRGQLSLTGPIAEGWSYRVGLAEDRWNGSFDNSTVPSGLRIGGYESTFASAALRFRRAEAFEANLSAYYSDDELGPSPQAMFQGNCEVAPMSTKALAWCGEYPSFDRDTNLSGYDPRAFGSEREILRTALNLTWNFDASSLTSLTGYNTLDTISLVDWERQYPGLPFAVRNTTTGAVTNVNLTQLFSGGAGELEELSQELRLQSSGDAPLQWIVGASYYDFSNDVPGPAAVDTSPLAANQVAVLAPVLPGMFTPIGPVADPRAFTYEFSHSKKLTRTVAGFGALSYTFADALTLRAELRYTEETKELRQLDTRQPPATATIVSEETFDFWTPRFTADYRLSEDVLLYASAAKGVKSGGFNSSAPTPAELPFDPEENWTYEIGAKTDWLDRRLRLNVAAFVVKMDGIQITNPSPNAPAAFITTNAGTGTSQGVEIELTAQATERLRVTTTYSLADAEFDKARDGSLRSYPSFATNQDVSGQRLPRQAKHLATFGLDYEAPAFGDFQWYGHADARYESERNGFTHEYLGYIGDRTILNARLGLVNESWDVALWVRNLTNDDTPVLANSTLTLNDFLRQPISVLPDLRSYGVTANYRF